LEFPPWGGVLASADVVTMSYRHYVFVPEIMLCCLVGFVVIDFLIAVPMLCCFFYVITVRGRLATTVLFSAELFTITHQTLHLAR